MKINAISPAFKGFVKIYKIDNEKDYFVNTANILNIEGDTFTRCDNRRTDRKVYENKGQNSFMNFGYNEIEADKFFVNSITFKDEDGKKIKIENIHKELENDEEYEEPMGHDFVVAAAKVCAEADKTGEILSIGV